MKLNRKKVHRISPSTDKWKAGKVFPRLLMNNSYESGQEQVRNNFRTPHIRSSKDSFLPLQSFSHFSKDLVAANVEFGNGLEVLRRISAEQATMLYKKIDEPVALLPQRNRWVT
jgi:hypothetical protein